MSTPLEIMLSSPRIHHPSHNQRPLATASDFQAISQSIINIEKHLGVSENGKCFMGWDI